MPVGGEDDYVVLETVGSARDFAAEGFEPRDHLALGEVLGAIDMERGAKVSGARFYFLTGVGARLELAPAQPARSHRPIAAGFTPMITPTLVKPEVMAGAGFLDAPRRRGLPARGRRPLPHRHLRGRPRRLPRRRDPRPVRRARCGTPGWSTCYRREAGSYGKDTRGIIRVHQFHKVEMFVYCRPEDAAAEHERLLGWEKEMLAAIELPYRVIDTAAGDLGGPAARKFDCEAWVPTQGRYRELTSTSNCTTFQARRLNIRSSASTGNARSPPRSTARWPPPAGSSPSWRTTSRPTARSSCPRRCGRTSASTCSPRCAERGGSYPGPPVGRPGRGLTTPAGRWARAR